MPTIMPLRSTFYNTTVPTETSSASVDAVVNMQSLTTDHDTIHLSDDAKKRYKNQQEEDGKQQSQQQHDKTQEERLEALQELLKVAYKHFHDAQDQMTVALENIKNAENEDQRKTAIAQMQRAQQMVIYAQSECLRVNAQISDVLGMG